ncbi:MAG: cytochrome c family protein [Pseudomonadota bacterium]
MLDTMTLTKLTGAFCGSLLVLLLGKFTAELIYHPKGHHGDDHVQGYVIDTGTEEVAEVEEEGPSFEELFAAADAGKGEKVFNKCKACHKLDAGANGTGPYLHGVVGRDVASADGFGYSGNLIAVVDVWSPEALDGFLTNPSGYAPGTTMAFAGLKKAEDRANLIAYLDQTDD